MSLTIDPQVEIYVVSATDGAGWLNISDLDLVLSDGVDAIEIRHGARTLLGGISEPSECSMVWNGRGGRLWPRNVESDLYGSLDRNTPIRVALGQIAHTFPGTVVNGWSAVGGYALLNTGSGGSVLASDFQQTPGVGTHSVPTTSAYRRSILDGYDQEDCEQTIEFRLPTSNVTGGALEPANLIFRWLSPDDDHIMLRLVVNTDETISMKFLTLFGGSDSDLTDTFTAPVTNSGQWLKVRANIEAHRLQAKIWDPTDPEPLEWVLNVEQSLNWSVFLNRGSVGVRTGVASGNSNTKPIVVEYRNWSVRCLPFYGEISDYRLEVDPSGEQIRIPIVAAGTTRRLTQGTPPVLSSLRRAIPQQPSVRQYWSLEDKSGVFGSALPGFPPMEILTGTPGYAEYSALNCTQPLPTGNGAEWKGLVPAYTHTGYIQVSFLLHLPAGDLTDRQILCRWYTGHSSAKFWQLIYRTTGGDLQLQAYNSETAFVYESGIVDFNLNDSARLISVQLSDSGANVAWEIRALNILTSSTSSYFTGTATGLQLASVKSVGMNLTFTDTPAFGHVVVQSELTDFFVLSAEVLAWDGLDSNEGFRIERLLNEAGIECTRERAPVGGIDMGPMKPGTTPALLEECVTLGTGGIWFDGRTHEGIMYRHRSALYNQETWVSLSYADGQLQPDWQPALGDRDLRNKVTVSRRDGSEATFALESGRLSILPPKDGGAGEYTDAVEVVSYDDADLQQMAAFRVAMGTVDEPVYPAARVEMASAPVLDDPTIRRRLLDLRPGRIFEVTDAEAVFQFGAAKLMVVGWTERISQFLHEYQLIGEPVGPYLVLELEHATLGALDSGTSTLTSDITSSATSFQVSTSNSGDLWTTSATYFPLDIEIGGEQITISAISGASSPQTFTVDTGGRAKNGATSAHLAGDEVHIYSRHAYALT